MGGTFLHVTGVGLWARRSHWLGLLAALMAACTSDSSDAAPWAADASASQRRVKAVPLWADPFVGLSNGAEQLAEVCARPGDDLVRDLFCAQDRPSIGSLLDLELALGLDPTALEGVTGAALTAHSSSLSRRSVSAINPRAILFRLGVAPANVEFVALAYARGEQFCELATLDRKAQQYSLYRDLSVAENLKFFSQLNALTKATFEKRAERLLRITRLGPFLDRRADGNPARVRMLDDHAGRQRELAHEHSCRVQVVQVVERELAAM